MSETADSGRVTWMIESTEGKGWWTGREVWDFTHDPNAAVAFTNRSVADWQRLNRFHGEVCVTEHVWIANTSSAALAAQGQGDAVAWMAEDGAALSARTSGRMGGINDGTRFISFKELKQGDYRHVFPLYTAPPASPAGVPDGWADVYAAFKGAFDTPAAWLKDNSEYANDARKRLREFNEAMLAAAQSAPEGGEVGL